MTQLGGIQKISAKDLLTIQRTTDDQLSSRIQIVEDTVSQIYRSDIVVDEISELSQDAGVFTAGEFQCGEGEVGTDFTGVRMGYPGFEYAGEIWNFVGINNEVLQVGIRAEDGKIVAGNNTVELDFYGIEIHANATVKKHISWYNDVLNEEFAYIETYYQSAPAFNVMNIVVVPPTGGGSAQLTLQAKLIDLNGSSGIQLNSSDSTVIIAANGPSGWGTPNGMVPTISWLDHARETLPPIAGHGNYAQMVLQRDSVNGNVMLGFGGVLKQPGASYLGRYVVLTNEPGVTDLTQRFWVDNEGVEFINAVMGSQITTPTTPASGKRKLYPKTDGWYDLDSSGAETKLGGGAATTVDEKRADCRLSLSSGVPVTTGNISATVAYLVPFNGDKISLYNGSVWESLVVNNQVLYGTRTVTGTLVTGSDVVTGLSVNAYTLSPGMEVTGTGIPLFATTILAILSSSSVQISRNATADGEQSLTFALSVDNNYDVFAFNVSGTVFLRAVGWSTGTARSTAVVLQNGIYVLSGFTSFRLIATVRTTSTLGQFTDTITQRYIWNAQNRIQRRLVTTDTTDSWSYSTATWRQARASGANKVNFVQGLVTDQVTATAIARTSNSGTTARTVATGVGVDSTSVNSASLFGQRVTSVVQSQHQALYSGFMADPGYHYLAWLEIGAGTDTQTWYGDNGSTSEQYGLMAFVWM